MSVKKLNLKGQALVEFVMVIPVIVFLLFSSFNFLKIVYEKTKLEGIMNDCIGYLENNEQFEEVNNKIKKNDKDLSLELKYQDDGYLKIKLSKNLVILTPGLNFIIDNPYKVKVERFIEYEKN